MSIKKPKGEKNNNTSTNDNNNLCSILNAVTRQMICKKQNAFGNNSLSFAATGNMNKEKKKKHMET